MSKAERTGFFNRTAPASADKHGLTSSLGGWLLLAVSLLLALLLVPQGGWVPAAYQSGEIAAHDIKAPQALLVEDVQLTETKREEAVAAVPLVYQLNRADGQVTVQRLRRALGLVLDWQNSAQSQDGTQLLQQLEGVLGTPVAGVEPWPLLELPLDQNTVELSADLLQPIFQRPIVADPVAFQSDRAAGARVLDSQGWPVAPELISRAIGLHEALLLARQQLDLIPGISPEQLRALLGLVQQQLRPTLRFDLQETERQRQLARDQVSPVLFRIKKGEMIVREGDRVSAEQALKLRALRASGQGAHSLRTAAGLLAGLLLLFLTGYRFARVNISKFSTRPRDLVFLAATLLCYLLLIKLSLVIATGLGNAFAYLDSDIYYYAFPFALGAMLVRIVLNSETALLFTLGSALLVGILLGNNLPLTFYVLVGCLVGAHGVRYCQQRSTLYRAGLWLGLTNMAMVAAIHFWTGNGYQLELLWKGVFGLAGGLLCAVLVNGLIPLVESVCKYTTDIKLLELANMNAPILRRLMVAAPGTYHHSILVGNLAEAAAESINANPLLVRVAAYYHDIGKIKKPLYFIENTGGHRNRHDKLAPSMSALILTSHVKDGVELAREYKLGSELVDIIRQHHGTALIKFFYERAKTQADPGVQQVDERDYRYHGPKPQTREAALIMLADAVEAASRTLTNPTQARIQGMVKKLINNIFIDGQLSECDLTLKDLHQIAKCFNRVLSGSFHFRIDYPEPVHIVQQKTGAQSLAAIQEGINLASANTDRQSTGQAQNSQTPVAEDRPEDIRRLGIS